MRAKSKNNSSIWLEDCINNKDERTYDITGKMHFPVSTSFQTVYKDGSKEGQPLNKISDKKVREYLLTDRPVETKPKVEEHLEASDVQCASGTCEI